jgi:hypothetical protein
MLVKPNAQGVCIACFLVALCGIVLSSARGDTPVDVGDRKQLFIDERFVASQEGLAFTVNPPVKREMVLRPAENEDGFQFLVSTILEVGDEYWMYYTTFRTDLPKEFPGATRHVHRIAKSTDGLTWHRPRVAIIDIDRGTDNSIVMTGAHGIFFIDPKKTDGYPYWWCGHMTDRPEWPESHGALYREGGLKVGGVYLCRSMDGMKWERVKDPILPFACDTRNQAFYDPRIDKYVAYLRARPKGHKNREVARAESAELVAAWPFTPTPGREKSESGLYGGLESELPIVLAPDERDPPGTGVYTPNVHLYPWADQVYLAFPEMYRLRDEIDSHGRDQRGMRGTANEGPLDIGIAVSRDGIDFNRFRTPYVRLGRIGEIDGGTMYIGVGMIRKGDEIWQYSTVSPHTHHGFFKRLAGTDGGIRRLVQRLDGFVSIDAGYDGGELTTPAIVFKGNRLYLNVDCSGMGEVWVEIQDEHGKPISEFSMDKAVSVDLNGVDQEVWWHAGPDVGSLAGKPIRLHIRMRSAKLFAFQFR